MSPSSSPRANSPPRSAATTDGTSSRCLEIKEPFTPSLAQLKPQLMQQLRAEKTKANSQAYVAQLLQENPVAINELALSQALGPKSTPPAGK